MRALVIGAGPGGATAALELARAGADVRLVEKSAWPREKTCGDGVSPLGVREGERMGLRFEGALRLHGALVSTPRATAFRGGWPAETPWGTIIERHAFDAALAGAAVAAGARFEPETAVREVRYEGDELVAALRGGGPRAGAREREVRADVAIVAEGATGSIAAKLGFPPFRSRLVALRGYVTTSRALDAEYGLFYERPLSPGYGWIFPVDRFRANAGVCVDERALARAGGNLRALLDRWLAESPFVRAELGARPQIEDVRGGVIPSGRRRRTAPGVFLVGDAAGVADPFTAEGIFQALRTGRLAARALVESPNADAARVRYERELRAFDRNDRAARALRATFDLAIEPYARRAAAKPRFADRLNTGAFFMKTGFARFIWDLTRAW